MVRTNAGVVRRKPAREKAARKAFHQIKGPTKLNNMYCVPSNCSLFRRGLKITPLSPLFITPFSTGFAEDC